MSFVGPLIPCFGLLVTSALGFKARVDSLPCVLACTLFLRFTSGEIPADLLIAGMAACHVPYMLSYMLSSADAGVRTGDLSISAQTHYPLGHRDRCRDMNRPPFFRAPLDLIYS